MEFLNKVKPLKNETLTSFVYRLFKANYFQSPSFLQSVYDFSIYQLKTNRVPFEISKQLEALSGKQELFQLSYDRLNISKEHENLLFLKSRTKYCSKCLIDFRYQDFTWGLNVITICPKHKCYLQTCCSNCEKYITVDMLFKNRCNFCHQILSEVDVIEVRNNHWLIYSQEEMVKALTGDIRTDHPSLNMFLGVIRAFAYLVNGLESFTQENKLKYTMSTIKKVDFYYPQVLISSLIADVFWIFHDVEKNLPLIMDKHYEMSSSRSLRRNREKFERMISTIEGGSRIYQSFLKYCNDRFLLPLNVPRNIKQYNQNANQYITSHYYTRKQLHDQFALTYLDVECILKDQELENHIVRRNGVTYLPIIETDKVIKKYLLYKEDCITKKELAALLGISVKVLKTLIDSDYKKYFSTKDQRGFYSAKKSKLWLQSLPLKKVGTVETLISVKDCVRKYSRRGFSLQFLMENLFKKTIEVYSSENTIKLSDLYFVEEEMKNALLAKRYLKGMTLSLVAKELDTTERTVKSLVEAKLLQNPKKEGESINTFTLRFEEEDIVLFKDKFLFIKQAMKEFNVSETAIRNAVYRGRINNYLKGTRKRTLLSREELDNYFYKRRTVY
jgi:TniQ